MTNLHYFKVNANCRICGIPIIIKVPNLFKKIKPQVVCEQCYELETQKDNKAQTKLKLESAINITNIPPQIKEQIINKFEPRPDQVKTVKIINDLIDKKIRMPYIYGTNGVGKTFLAYYCAIKIMQETLMPSYVINIASIISRIGKIKDIGFDFENCNLLIIDDLGAHSAYPYVLDLIYHILDSRSKNNKMTVITSLIPPFDLSQKIQEHGNLVNSMLCESIADRVIQLCYPIELGGNSIRIQTAIEDISINRHEAI